MSRATPHYLPAAGIDLLLPLYDPLVKLLGVDRPRRRLFDQAGVRPGHRVLDIGCGTGTLAVAIRQWAPAAQVTGLDPDPKALARAQRKAQRAGVALKLDRGFADALPYADASFDRVFSSLMFHHLPYEAKRPALREALRVLAPGGSLHLLDFEEEGHTHNPLSRWLHRQGTMKDNRPATIVAMMREAGFVEARLLGSERPLFGKIAYLAARRP